MEREQSLAEKLMGVTNPAGSRNGFGDIGEWKMSPPESSGVPKACDRSSYQFIAH